MGQDNRRQAVRVACDLPVRLPCDGGDLVARLLDLSRTGLRLRMPGDALGIHRLSSLAQITHRVEETLGSPFVGELHYEMLGPLVRKALRPTRIAKLDWARTDVEIGCLLLEPLSDEEAGMLGVALPAIGATQAPAALAGVGPHRHAPRLHIAPAEVADEPFVAWIYPEPGKTSKPLRTETLSLTRGMAMLGVDRRQGWDLKEVPVAAVVDALDQAYGTDIMIRIVDGADDVWAGPGEIQEVDITPSSGRIRLGVGFGRELRSEELDRMGLPTPA